MDIEENDLERLKELVNDSFLDKNLKCRKIFNEETGQEELDVYVLLGDINKLKLDEEEVAYIIEYLGSMDIAVRGKTSYYSGVCDNYTQYGQLSRKYSTALSEKKQEEYLEKYQETKDIAIRNKIVESNLSFVYYLSRRYAYYYGVEQEFLESYGCEGLIKAVEKYEVSKGKFSECLSVNIKASIFQAIIDYQLGQYGYSLLNKLGKKRGSNTKHFEYFYKKKEIENKTEKTLKDNPELIEEIANVLENSGYCKGENLENLKNIVSIHTLYSYDQIEEDITWVDNHTLYEKTLEKVYQEELVKFIKELEENLSEEERYIIGEIYGLDGRKSGKSATKLAKELNFDSRQALSFHKQNALNAMEVNSWKVTDKLASFLENSNHEYEGVTSNAYIRKRR